MGSGGIFGIGGSDSTATQSQQTAGDGAKQVRGNNSNVTEAGGLTIGTNGQLVSPGAVQVRNGSLNTGLILKGVKGNVTIGDGGAQVASLAQTFANTISGITQSNNATASGSTQAITDALTQALDKQSAITSSALGQATDLSANAQSGGWTTTQKTFLYLVLGALALVGVIFYFRR